MGCERDNRQPCVDKLGTLMPVSARFQQDSAASLPIACLPDNKTPFILCGAIQGPANTYLLLFLVLGLVNSGCQVWRWEGFKGKVVTTKYQAKCPQLYCFCFRFILGESFCGRDNIESANGVITPNSFALTEIQVSFFFPCPAEIIPCRNERSEVYGDRVQCVGESQAAWIYGVCGSRSLVMLIYATNDKDTKNTCFNQN